MLAITENNVLVNVTAGNKEEVIRTLADLLVKNGCITPGYYDILIAREKDYPTGIPIGEINVAIPHGFSDNDVIKPGAGIATLEQPVLFRNMFNPDEELPVRIVLVVALSSKDKNYFAEELSKVMSILSNKEILSGLITAKNGKEVTEIMSMPIKEY